MRPTEVPLRERTHGRWRAILATLGLRSEFMTGKNSPCPWCAGRDRWRFINRDGSGNWICNQCGMGDGIDLAMRLTGMEFAATAVEIERILGQAGSDRDDKPKEVSIEAMRRLWQAAALIGEASPGWRYFHRRGLAVPPGLRFHGAVYHDRDQRAPAILAQVASPEGRCVNLYRIFITPEGEKAPIERPKRMMRARVVEGCAIRLYPAGVGLGVAEGIENAQAAHQRFGTPTWATTGTSFMERLVVPQGVEELTIFADNDSNYAGQKAAYTLANKQAAKMQIRVELPPRADQDWNDLVRLEAAA